MQWLNFWVEKKNTGKHLGPREKRLWEIRVFVRDCQKMGRIV